MAGGTVSTKLNIDSNLAELVGDISSATKSLKQDQKQLNKEMKQSEKRGGLSARGDLAARQADIDIRKGRLALAKRTDKLITKRVKVSTKEQVRNSVGGLRDTISGLARGDVRALQAPGKSLKRMRGRLIAGGHKGLGRLAGTAGSLLASGAVLGAAGAGVLALRQLHVMRRQNLIDGASAARIQGDIMSGIRTMGMTSGASASDMQGMVRRVSSAGARSTQVAAQAEVFGGIKQFFGMGGAHRLRGQQTARATQQLLMSNKRLGSRITIAGSKDEARRKFLLGIESGSLATRAYEGIMNAITRGRRFDNEVEKLAEERALNKAQTVEKSRAADMTEYKTNPTRVNDRINALTTSHHLRAIEQQKIIKISQWNPV